MSRLPRWTTALLVGAIAGSLLAVGALAIRFRQFKHDTAGQSRRQADCIINGVRYHSGEHLPSFDHCNFFRCRDGDVEGTKKACTPKRPVTPEVSVTPSHQDNRSR